MEIQQYIKDYTTLTKPKVNLLLVITALSAIFLASDNFPSFQVLIAVVVGGTFASGGAGAINHSIDKDIDNTMKRTSARPVAGERISKLNALIFGVILNVASFIILTLLTNVLAAFMAISGTLFYVLIYSIWLKKKTFHNIVIGGAAGCFPPLVGWSAVTGDLSLSAWYLFAIIFFWTPPHFWALAMLMKDDYSKAKIPMLPSVVGIEATFKPMTLHTITLILLTLVMTFVNDKLSYIYFLSCATIGIYYLYLTYKLYKDYDRNNNLKIYKFSLLYMMLYSVIVIADSLI
ncbi:MAG: protoheme IX farnesyltransferase [Chloroflexi bacterium]|nr:protoheme IX farnesyltransferase [Chloroflexota bacterium]|tara:strand:+ start:550 stop:1419 length:870 start_codon:yes stop_codon:yes gene_type:complete